MKFVGAILTSPEEETTEEILSTISQISYMTTFVLMVVSAIAAMNTITPDKLKNDATYHNMQG